MNEESLPGARVKFWVQEAFGLPPGSAIYNYQLAKWFDHQMIRKHILGKNVLSIPPAGRRRCFLRH